jgi:hypothetical protein
MHPYALYEQTLSDKACQKNLAIGRIGHPPACQKIDREIIFTKV